jgi:hypothetical protein
MSFLLGKARQLLQAMEFANIDRLDELERLLEQRVTYRSSRDHGDQGHARVSRRNFGDPRIIDFVAFTRRTALRSSGRGG